MQRRVVITGLGTYNPLGHDVQTTWERARDGQSGIALVPEWEQAGLSVTYGGAVKEFDPVALFGRREARRMERVAQLALAAANQALEDAGLTNASDIDRDRVGVIIGSGIGGVGALVENMVTFQERGPSRVSPFFVPMLLPDTAPGLIAIVHGFRGPNMCIATACASANNAIGEAAQAVRDDKADILVTGGAEAALQPVIIAGFQVMGALSSSNGDPTAASRPFDADRSGFVPAEGAAMLILEEREHALARGAQIYAEVLGYGASADAFHISSPAEDGGGAVLSMRRALSDAGLSPDEIDYINAHGTSTPLNDKTETLAIKQVFGAAAYEVPVSATKSVHGHLLGAAGALEAVISIAAMQHGVIPPTINYRIPDPDCDLDYVPNVARPAELRRVMSNSFGFGGHNATLIFGAPEE